MQKKGFMLYELVAAFVIISIISFLLIKTTLDLRNKNDFVYEQGKMELYAATVTKELYDTLDSLNVPGTTMTFEGCNTQNDCGFKINGTKEVKIINTSGSTPGYIQIGTDYKKSLPHAQVRIASRPTVKYNNKVFTLTIPLKHQELNDIYKIKVVFNNQRGLITFNGSGYDSFSLN